MSIILAPITGGVRCGYSSNGPTKKKKKRLMREKGGGGGDTLSSFSVWYPWLKSVKGGGLHYFHG